MNTGLVDATVLGQLLAKVLVHHEPDSTLDLYEQLRRPAAKSVLELAGGLTRMAVRKSLPGRLFRNAQLMAMGHLPMARRRMVMNLSGLSRRALAQVNVRGGG